MIQITNEWLKNKIENSEACEAGGLVTVEFINAQYDLIDKAREFFEDDAKASFWLNTTNKGLGWKKPLDVPFIALEFLELGKVK